MAEKIPANGDLQVFVASSAATLRANGVAPPYAVLVPSSNDWDNYGTSFFADLWIVNQDGEREEYSLHIMFEGFERTKKALNELIAKFGDPFEIEKIDIPFVSLIPKDAYYHEVVQSLGFDNAITMLRKLHDAIVLRLEQYDPTLLAMVDTEAFHVGMLRQVSARTAWRTGGRHFRRDVPEPVVDSAVKISVTATLPSATNEIEVTFDFTEKPIIRDRIGVLIGRNGVGKTQFLNAIVNRLPTSVPRTAGAARPVCSRVLLFSSVPSDPYPKDIPAWLGIDYEYLPVSTPGDKYNDPLLAALVSCRFEHSPARFGPSGDQSRMDVIEEVLEKMGLWARLCLPIRERAGGENLGYVVEVDGKLYMPIEAQFNERDTLRFAQRVDWTRSPAVLDRHRKVRELSSGEYAMLRFVAQAAASIDRGSLLLLDEPETHLHPNYVSDLIDVLYSLLTATGSVAIIATHSAYLVREVSRDSVKVLSLDEKVLSVDAPRRQTFGASIDSISQFVFGDTNSEHRYQDVLRDWANTSGRELGLDAIIERYGDTLNSESLSYIARVLKQPRPADGE